MRILGVAQQLRTVTSGLGTYARGLVDGLVRRGHTVTLAVPSAQAEARDGARLVPMAFTPGNVTPVAALRMGREVRRVLAAEGPHHDVVHFLDAREAVLAGPPRAGERRGFVGTVHDAYALDWRVPGFPRDLYDDRVVRGLYYAWLRRIERVAYERTALLATNSRYVAAVIGRGYGVSADRVHVVPIGLSRLPAVTAEPLSGAPAVLFVGGNFQRKGLGTLLEAFAELQRRQPAARLHVVGGDPQLPRYRQRAISAGMETAVVFHGWQPHERVRALMAGATVFAMAPLVEAFGLVYLEAMAAGVPVVATAVGGAAELLRDGTNALLVPRGDARALADALGRAAADAALRDRLRAGGAETVARCSMDATVAATEALYARAAGAR
jgi:glycosyltransferase involved in cell wall biosynthesis